MADTGKTDYVFNLMFRRTHSFLCSLLKTVGDQSSIASISTVFQLKITVFFIKKCHDFADDFACVAFFKFSPRFALMYNSVKFLFSLPDFIVSFSPNLEIFLLLHIPTAISLSYFLIYYRLVPIYCLLIFASCFFFSPN